MHYLLPPELLKKKGWEEEVEMSFDRVEKKQKV